jgi:hypothetical protein
MEKKKNKFNSIKRRKKIHIWTKKERNQWPRGLFFIKLLLYFLFFLTKIYIVVVFYYIKNNIR